MQGDVESEGQGLASPGQKAQPFVPDM